MSKSKQQTSDLWGIWRIRPHTEDRCTSIETQQSLYVPIIVSQNTCYILCIYGALSSLVDFNNFIGLRKWGKNGDLPLSRFNQNQLKTYHGESFKIIIKNDNILLLGTWYSSVPTAIAHSALSALTQTDASDEDEVQMCYKRQCTCARILQ